MIATLVLMLTPWSPQLPADQIWMGEEVPPIRAEVLDLPQGRRFAVRAFEWVQLKRRAEAMGSYCQDAVNLATSPELNLDEQAFRTCLANEQTRIRVEDEVALAEAAGITATPAIAISGLLYSGKFAPSEIAAIVERNLAPSLFDSLLGH